MNATRCKRDRRYKCVILDNEDYSMCWGCGFDPLEEQLKREERLIHTHETNR